MTGTVTALKPTDFEEWLRSRAEGSLALQGRKTFLKYRCLSCHSADGQSRAPLLENVFGQTIPLTGGRTAVADEDYIRESILNPRAKVVAGYESIMPTFQGQISESEIIELIAFIRTLKTGDTPPRVEDFPPPAETPSINTKEAPK
jgi:cytochrome c oxidase subunit 2